MVPSVRLIGVVLALGPLCCCRKGDPFQSPRAGSWLTLGNELSEETHVLTKQETLLVRGARAESSRVREPRRTALHVARSLGFHGDGVSFRLSLANHLAWPIFGDSGSFLVARASLSQDGFQHEGFWEVGRTYYGLASPPFSFQPLPNSPR